MIGERVVTDAETGSAGPGASRGGAKVGPSSRVSPITLDLNQFLQAMHQEKNGLIFTGMVHSFLLYDFPLANVCVMRLFEPSR